jgi:phage gp29-like protein
MLRHLLTWMVAVNFGAAEPVPTLAFSTDDIGDTDRAAKVLDTAVNKLSLPVSQAHAYAVLGIPQPANGEALLSGATVGPRTAATPPPGDADPDPDADPTPPGDEEPTP